MPSLICCLNLAFGRKTALDFPAEASGHELAFQKKAWAGTPCILSYGYGQQVTLAQLARGLCSTLAIGADAAIKNLL